jgi:GT2 family glycosyltransferase
MLLSVIIPTCHRNDLLAKCLDCLAPGKQTLRPEQYEVIVSDDGSNSTAQEMLKAKYPWARWIQGPRRGPAANRNYGANLALGEWFVFTDDDCLPDLNLLEVYSAAILQNKNIDLFEGKVAPTTQRPSLAHEAPHNFNGGLFLTANLAVRKSTFNALGLFNQTFPYAACEDTEFRIRFQKSCYKAIFLPDAIVLHPWRKLEASLCNVRLLSYAHLLTLHPGLKPSITRFIINHIRGTANYIIHNISKCDKPQLFEFLRYSFGDFMIHLRFHIRTRE